MRSGFKLLLNVFAIFLVEVQTGLRRALRPSRNFRTRTRLVFNFKKQEAKLSLEIG